MKFFIRSLVIILFVVGLLLLGRFSYNFTNRFSKNTTKKPTTPVEKSKPLKVYTIANLSQTEIRAGNFELGSEIDTNDKYSSYNFNFYFYPNPEKPDKKNTSGLINIPDTEGGLPIIVMLRGYIDQEIYETGMGTKRVGGIFAENGFITVAPDFLGYAKSDKEAENIFESRFQTYTTALSLIKSLYQIDGWDGKNILLWGHSNGGQVALTILEITGNNFPASLWAPVSKPFPYSILYYTDEAEDRGKLIRTELAKFENDYDVELYSLDNYYENISAPIQLHQGTADDAVPKDWTDALANILLDLNPTDGETSLSYHIYPGADHNMKPLWDEVVERDVQFFQEHIKN